MVEGIIYVVVGILVGSVIGWLSCKLIQSKLYSNKTSNDLNKILVLEKELSTNQANLITTKEALDDQIKITSEKQIEIDLIKEDIAEIRTKITQMNAEKEYSDKKLKDNIKVNEQLDQEYKSNIEIINNANIIISTKDGENKALSLEIENLKAYLFDKKNEITEIKNEIKEITNSANIQNIDLAASLAENSSLNDKLKNQKKEIEEIGTKFKLEFENIASKILETNTEKFTEINKTNIKGILDPLSTNLEQFKNKINETYDKESKERFSLGEKVKELASLNKIISEEAKNLTNALKGDSKTQGRWGEMILESILERSGLTKDQEYFVEYQLEDSEGNPLKSESENKKMRPDVVIKYPDNRCIIIDSKVSLNSFVRYMSSDNLEEQKKELDDHIKAVKTHIISLSKKGYDDYDQSLDFVMMFIPNEPAYMAALKGDPDLWNFAYDKRILLINPTNLIISLKLIVDLWKREYQNKNAQDIAERGAKLYDKFVGFLTNFSNIEKYLDKSKEAYNSSLKQLNTGNDNLIIQTTKLKNLGIKNKKSLPENFIQKNDQNMLIDNKQN
ncbi:MAG: DNA recombination protein RmuC [Spirochaetaceae bacterium]